MNESPQVISDLKEDFDELCFLFDSNLEKLLYFRAEFKSARNAIAKTTYSEIEKYLFEQIKKNDKLLKDLVLISDKIRNKNNTADIVDFRLKKYKYQDLARTLIFLSSALITATDWQSPSYNHSINSNAGRQTGKITGTINDYKRDIHLDESQYENAFLKEYIEAKYKFLLRAYLVNSGQAAFQTILTYLSAENKIKGKVFVGQSSYFQYKQILSGIFRRNLKMINETDTDKILKQVQDDEPVAIFLDSICNSSDISIPNLKIILDYLYRNCRKETYVIIDNTCMAAMCQPFQLRGRNHLVHLISFESLNKYYQFGTDRVTAGIIVAEKRDWNGINEYRKHAGTNINDISVFALPKPNRILLQKRLERHCRNALDLARFLQSESQFNNKIINKIVYPGLADHASYEWNAESRFFGSFLNIHFNRGFNSPLKLKRFIDLTVETAKKNQVRLIAGTSFGLNTSRIYLTSLWSKYGKPFLRIALGTEDCLEMEKLKEVFKITLDKLAKNPFYLL